MTGPALDASYAFPNQGEDPMIEFNALVGGQQRIYILQISTIAHVTRAGTSRTSVVLTNGTEITAMVPYERFRDALSTVRSQFVSLLEAAPA